MGHEFASRGNVLGISAGTQSASSGTLVFSNSNGVSFGLNGATLTASVLNPGVSYLPFGFGQTTIPNGAASLTFQRSNLAQSIVLTRAAWQVSNANAAANRSMSIALYIMTMSGSTAQSIASGSATGSLASTAIGVVSISFPATTLTAGDYLFVSSYSGNNVDVNLYGVTMVRPGTDVWGPGILTLSTASTTVQLSQISSGTGANAVSSANFTMMGTF